MKILRRATAPRASGEILLQQFNRSKRRREYATCFRDVEGEDWFCHYFSEYEAAFGDFEQRLQE